MFFEVINFIAFEYHDNHLFHGDIKPQNIFISGGSNKKTTDLGSIMYLGEQIESE